MLDDQSIQKYLSSISQEDYDDWIDGRRSISSLIEDHRMIAMIFKPKIFEAIDEYEPDEIIQILQEERPDLEIRDTGEAKERIQEEFRGIREALSL